MLFGDSSRAIERVDSISYHITTYRTSRREEPRQRREFPVSDSLQVWVDADFLTDMLQIGTLTHDRGAIRFAYDPSWLQHPLSFAIDPDLSLSEGVFHPKPQQGNFRAFDDSA